MEDLIEKKDDIATYTAMQKLFYKACMVNPKVYVVGHYDYHENVPYETNLLHLYGDIRRPIFEDFQSKRALDICCGEGRMIRRMQKLFGQVDGADISEEMIALAKENTPNSNLWVTNGQNCGDAPSAAYDFVYCTISLQHISVFEIRDRIMKDVMRILKPGGKVTFQYLFSRDFPFLQVGRMADLSKSHGIADFYLKPYQLNNRHASWYVNNTAANTTNSGSDVLFGENDIPMVRDYFKNYFHEVDMWFHDISIGRSGYEESIKRQLPDTHPNSHKTGAYHGTHLAFIHLAKRCDA